MCKLSPYCLGLPKQMCPFEYIWGWRGGFRPNMTCMSCSGEVSWEAELQNDAGNVWSKVIEDEGITFTATTDLLCLNIKGGQSAYTPLELPSGTPPESQRTTRRCHWHREWQVPHALQWPICTRIATRALPSFLKDQPLSRTQWNNVWQKNTEEDGDMTVVMWTLRPWLSSPAIISDRKLFLLLNPTAH